MFRYSVKQFIVTKQCAVKAYRNSRRKAPCALNLGGGGSARIQGQGLILQVTKTYRRVDIGLYSLLVSAIGRSKWSASRCGCINPRDRDPLSVFGPRSSCGSFWRTGKIFCPLPASTHNCSVVYRVAGERQVV